MLEISEDRQFDIIARLRAGGCVFAEDEARLLITEARTLDDLTGMIDRRVEGLPLEHVIGWAEFCGLRMVVQPGVFVPRRRSEFLVQQAAAIAKPRCVVVDLCCGSGAIGVALSAVVDPIELYAVDIDRTAVQCARRNVAARGQVYEGDLYDPLPVQLQGRVDLVIANAPYVPTDDMELMPQEARIHEPRVALDGGLDGLDVQRRVAASAPLWLAPGGKLLVETSVRQTEQTIQILAVSGLIPKVAQCSDLGATVVIGARPLD